MVLDLQIGLDVGMAIPFGICQGCSCALPEWVRIPYLCDALAEVLGVFVYSGRFEMSSKVMRYKREYNTVAKCRILDHSGIDTGGSSLPKTRDYYSLE